MHNIQLYFDIDGVLNRKPQLGETPFHWENDCLLVLQRIIIRFPAIELICISLHRHYPAVVKKLPLIFTCAKHGPKRQAVWKDKLHLILDDQPQEYLPTHNVYPVNGETGLANTDFEPICHQLQSLYNKLYDSVEP